MLWQAQDAGHQPGMPVNADIITALVEAIFPEKATLRQLHNENANLRQQVHCHIFFFNKSVHTGAAESNKYIPSF